MPNNPLPFLVYKGAVDVDNDQPEMTIERLFGANGWGDMWRNGVYDYLHYHATVHEVLGVARGHARVRFGGDRQGIRDCSRRCRDPARRHRASMPFGEQDFSRGRRLSAGTEDGCQRPTPENHAQGAEDDSGGEVAEDRSGDGETMGRWCSCGSEIRRSAPTVMASQRVAKVRAR